MSVSLLGDQLLYTVLPSQPGVAGIAPAALGVVLSIHRFVRLATNSVSGVLYDRFDCRQLYLLGMVLAVTSTAGYLVSTELWSLLLARLVWGLAFSLISVGGLSVLLELTTTGDRGRAVGLYQSLVSLGTLIELAIGGALVDLLGYRTTLAIFVPLTAAGWVVVYAVLPPTGVARPTLSSVLGARRHAAHRATESVAVVSGRSDPGGVLAGLRGLDRRFLAPVYVGFVSFFAVHGVLMSTLGLALRQRMQAPPAPAAGAPAVASLTGMLLAARKLVAMLVAPCAGYVYDRTGAPRLVAAIGARASVVGFAVLAASDDVPTAVAGVVLASVGEGILQPSLTAWTGELAPPGVRGVIVGLYATANDLGGALGPLVGYALAGSLGLSSAYWLCAGLFGTGLVVLFAVAAPARR